MNGSIFCHGWKSQDGSIENDKLQIFNWLPYVNILISNTKHMIKNVTKWSIIVRFRPKYLPTIPKQHTYPNIEIHPKQQSRPKLVQIQDVRYQGLRFQFWYRFRSVNFFQDSDQFCRFWILCHKFRFRLGGCQITWNLIFHSYTLANITNTSLRPFLFFSLFTHVLLQTIIWLIL